METQTWPTPVIPEPATRSATPSMVVGIVGASLGLLIGWFLPFIPLGLGVAGLFLVKDRVKDGQRTAGLVLAIINTVLGGIGTLWWVAVVLLFASSASTGYYA